MKSPATQSPANLQEVMEAVSIPPYVSLENCDVIMQIQESVTSRSVWCFHIYSFSMFCRVTTTYLLLTDCERYAADIY